MQIWRYIFNFAYHTSLLKSHIFISILSHNSDICLFLSYFFSLSLRWAVLHYYLFVMLSNLLRFIFTSSFICAHTIYSSCLSNFIPGLFYMGMPLYVHTTTNWLRVAEPVLLLFCLWCIIMGPDFLKWNLYFISLNVKNLIDSTYQLMVKNFECKKKK